MNNSNDLISCLTIEIENEIGDNNKQVKINCLKCTRMYTFPNEKNEYLGHLFLNHRLVIADVEDIADLKEYLIYWSIELQKHDLEHYCTTMLLDKLPDGTSSKNEKYYLLSDILPKDSQIRNKLHVKRLEKILAQHQFELTDRSFSRECIHCRDVIKGLRSEFLDHLYNKHFVQLGKAENLVYIDDLINIIQNKLDNLICLYCEKVFKDRSTLKEHMRKKGHKRINPELKFYDKFFLINYKMEKSKGYNHSKKFEISGKKELPICEEQNGIRNEKFNRIIQSDDDDSNWSDWEGENRKIKCLFCLHKNPDFCNIKLHMLEEHDINFDELVGGFSFYDKIKIINFVRRQFHIMQCISCNQRFDSRILLEEHLINSKHYTIGERIQWDRAEFFFPTYEDDELLCHLDDGNDLDKTPVLIYSEDTSDTVNNEAEKLSLETFASNVSKLF